MIDDKNIEILNIIKENVQHPNAEIAKRVGMAPSAVLERIRKMEKQGVIQGYEVRLNPKLFGMGLTAFIFIKTDNWARGVEVGGLLAAIPEVQEVHHIAGEDCLLAKVRTSDTESLGRFLRDKIGVLPSVYATRTTVVLMTEKETIHFPVQDPEGRGKGAGLNRPGSRRRK
jgi:Lrp/AsnC family transcriptional regulator, leucine-responsive regulatory protein